MFFCQLSCEDQLKAFPAYDTNLLKWQACTAPHRLEHIQAAEKSKHVRHATCLQTERKLESKMQYTKTFIKNDLVHIKGFCHV